eukprot:symbB.v1.2.017296.t1/scaffold1343.1/size124258/5
MDVDTRTRFVASDPGARFDAAAPLEYEVHPIWAGTFVLAAPVAMFPGINFVLLDSDCLPITLFEVEDLWTEAYLARFPAHSESGISQAHPLRAFARFSKDPQVVYTQNSVCSTRMEQGLLWLLNHSHPLFDWNAWSLRLRSSSGSVADKKLKDEASNLAFAFWNRLGEFLTESRTDNELSALLQNYQCRTPRIVAWARAAFEQEALSSLLLLPGIAPVFSLPGDRMWVWKDLLPRLQLKGGFLWLLQCSAPRISRPCGPVLDFGQSQVQPLTSGYCLPYFRKGRSYLCYRAGNRSVSSSALSQWLVGIDVEKGPDGYSSPTFLKPNFNAQEAADLYQAVHLHTLEDLAEHGPYPKVISQFALRIITYEYPLEAILAIYFLSATGHLPDKFPHDQWIEAVKWHGDTKIAAIIHTEAEMADAKIILATLENVVVEAESQHGAVVWSSAQDCPPSIPTNAYPLQLIVLPGEELQRHLPETLHVEATGLGGRDLTYPVPWDISIRSDKEGQSVYGPSLALMEEKVDVPGLFGGTETVQITALGKSKAAHEFLVLHYFGLDSAKHWDALLSEVLPAVQLPGASARRATALEMFGASHITPSHRRMAHVLWTDSMTLIWTLLMGGRMGRYTGSPDTLAFDQRIDLRGFSAGSFAA